MGHHVGYPTVVVNSQWQGLRETAFFVRNGSIKTRTIKFELDRIGFYLLNYNNTNFEENILSGQFDSLDSAAGNASIVLMPNNGGRRIENGKSEKLTSFADNPFIDSVLSCQYACPSPIRRWRGRALL
jgi:hypothetical protein